MNLTADELADFANAYDRGRATTLAWVEETIAAHREQAVAMADMETGAPGRHGGLL